jgi:hypothetical protein
MVEHSLAALLKILSSSSVGMDALTTHVAIFGVLQNAHACATTGDELGVEYVRMFIARLAQQTPDHEKVARVTEVLQQRLREQCLRAESQIWSLSKVMPLKSRQAEDTTEDNEQTKALAQQLAVERPLSMPDVRVKPRNDLMTSQPTQYDKTRTQITPASTTAAEVTPTGSSQSRQPAAKQPEMSKEVKGMARDAHVPRPSASRSPRTVVKVPNVPHGRPHHHVYPCTSSGGKDEVCATISADIRNYTEPGEDLDWTKVSDPERRRRLQGIIGGRKYRERRLAAQGKGGSGGNYPGASGVGSYISAGCGPQRPYGYSKSRSPQLIPRDAASADPKHPTTSTPGTLLHKALGIQPGSSASPVADSNGTAQRLSNGESRKRRVVNASSGGNAIDSWTDGRSADSIDHSDGQIARDSHGSTVIISDDEQETNEKSDGQVGYQDFYMSLMDSASRKESRARYKKTRTDIPTEPHRPGLAPNGPTPTLLYHSDDDRATMNEERSTWEPNAGNVALFVSDKPMKTAYNMFARSAHDAHRFPARTRKNVVERYHLYIRQVWSLLLEQDKTAWRSLAAARGCFSPAELSVKDQHILASQGFLAKFLPHVEPDFEGA